MLISPILNKGIENLSKSDYKKLIITSLFADCYIGYFLGYECVDKYGYETFNFIVMYLLGGYLKEHVTCSSKNSILSLSISILATFLIAKFIEGGFVSFSYNQPTVIMTSCSMILLFKNITLSESKIVTKLSGASLSCFLLNHATLISLALTPYLTAKNLLNLLAGYIAIFIGGVILTEIVRLLMKYILAKPVVWLDKKYNQL